MRSAEDLALEDSGLASWTCLAASAAVVNEAPNSTKSLIRNCPASPREGTPWLNSMAPGVVNRKLIVRMNVTTAPRLPIKDAFAENGRNAIRTATRISMQPMMFETPCMLSTLYIHDMNGLCATRG